MTNIGEAKTALQEHAPDEVANSKEPLADVNDVSRENREVVSTVSIKTCVNGKRERVNFLNCKEVEVTVTDGKITYNPSPSFFVRSPPSPLVEPNNSLPAENIGLFPPLENVAHQPLTLALPHMPLPDSSPHPPCGPCDPAIFSPCLMSPTLSPSPSVSAPIVPNNIENPKGISLVVELPSFSCISPIGVDAQPITLSSHSSEDSSFLDSSNSEGDSSTSNLAVKSKSSIWGDKAMSKGEKMWKMAKDIGVTGTEGEEFYVQNIEELEARDKACIGQKETLPGVK